MTCFNIADNSEGSPSFLVVQGENSGVDSMVSNARDWMDRSRHQDVCEGLAESEERLAQEFGQLAEKEPIGEEMACGEFY